MPTAARLVAALALAGSAIIMVFVLIQTYPEERWDRDTGALIRLFAFVGFMVGWRGLGRRVAVEDPRTGMMLGVRAAISVTIWLVAILSIYYVVGEILDDQLRGAEPMQAVFQMFAKGWEYLAFLAHPRIIGAGLFLGVLCGVLTRNTHRRWA